jgi:hypothetical protein
MNEIPILIDPSLELDAAMLKAAWEQDAQAQTLGKMETHVSRQYTGILELVLIPVLVSISSELIVEAIKRLLPKQKKPVDIVVQPTSDGQESIMLQQKS